jgi:hypothetical protein
MRRWAIAAVALAGCVPEAASAETNCKAGDGLSYICGPVASEDIAHIPGTHWLITGGLRTDKPGHLFAIDTRTRKAAILPIAVRPEAGFGKDCPGPPDPALLSIDGIALRPGKGSHHKLYAANHGGREAIELFRIDARGKAPRIAWTGCQLMPKGTLANAIVPLPDGGIIVSSFHDPDDPAAWERMARGEPTGSLWEWHARTGFRRLDAGPISGANGLALSADGRTLYVSAWSAHALIAFDRQSRRRRTIPLDFLPDNIRRSADGTLLVAGQAAKVADIAACKGPVCAQDWVVARVDPVRGTVRKLVTRKGNATVSYACGAIELGDMLYITARADRRIVTIPLTALPSLH